MDGQEGLLTFLLTDIEGSAKAWEANPAVMRQALAHHDRVMEDIITGFGGTIFKTLGDGVCAVFHEPSGAVAAALSIQMALAEGEAGDWETGDLIPHQRPLRTRMGIHTGAAEESGGDYLGPAVNRAARIRDAAHGGQILLSQTTASLVEDRLPQGATLRQLGLHRLKDLQRPENLYQLAHPALPAEFGPLRTLSVARHNLPMDLTSFIGRDREMEEVRRHLGAHRLVTLTGAGGCGKTRLALHVAAESAADFSGGVWLVELGSITDASLVPGAIAAALNVREDAQRLVLEAIADQLQDKEALLILDNCEHLLDGASRAAEYLLRRCTEVRILATSREPLGVAGETVWRVPSLAVPIHDTGEAAEILQCDAVQLFLDRADAVVAGYKADAKSASTLLRICRSLDGIPLAIELAAAKVRVLSLEQIAERLNNRFALLSGGMRTAMTRHRTLRATIEWSYDLLSEEEKLLLQRLAVFAGGFTLEAAEFVCCDTWPADDTVLQHLTALVDKSMVVVDEDGEALRYRLLETVREFAQEKLSASGQTENLRERHLTYYRDMAEEASTGLIGPDQAMWLERLEREHDNMRAAIQWCRLLPTHDEDGLRLAGALARFWFLRGYLSEGRRHLASVMAHRVRRSTRGWAMAHNGAGILAYAQSDFSDAVAHYEAALGIFHKLGDTSGTARTLNNLGLALVFHQSPAEAMLVLGESLKLHEDLGEAEGVAKVLNNLGIAAFRQGSLDEARNYYWRSLRIRREMGAEGAMAECLTNLGEIAFAEQNFAEAGRLFGESLAILRRIGDRRALVHVCHNWGEVLFKMGDLPGARNAFRESLELARFLGDVLSEVRDLCHLGEVAAECGDLAEARDAFRRATQMGQPIQGEYAYRGRVGLAWVALQEGDGEQAAILLGAAHSLFVPKVADTGPLAAKVEEQARSILGKARFEAAFAAGQANEMAAVQAAQRPSHGSHGEQELRA